MIPNAIIICNGNEVPIEQVTGLPERGHWQENGNLSVVRIREDQPEAAKLLTLIHEMIHMAESQLMNAGVLSWFYGFAIRGIWGERLVDSLSSFLFQWMALSGMLTGCSPQEARDFIDSSIESGDAVGVK